MDPGKGTTQRGYRDITVSTSIPRIDGLSMGPSGFGGVTPWYQSLGKRLPRELECGYPQVIPETSIAW